MLWNWGVPSSGQDPGVAKFSLLTLSSLGDLPLGSQECCQVMVVCFIYWHSFLSHISLLFPTHSVSATSTGPCTWKWELSHQDLPCHHRSSLKRLAFGDKGDNGENPSIERVRVQPFSSSNVVTMQFKGKRTHVLIPWEGCSDSPSTNRYNPYGTGPVALDVKNWIRLGS